MLLEINYSYPRWAQVHCYGVIWKRLQLATMLMILKTANLLLGMPLCSATQYLIKAAIIVETQNKTNLFFKCTIGILESTKYVVNNDFWKSNNNNNNIQIPTFKYFQIEYHKIYSIPAWFHLIYITWIKWVIFTLNTLFVALDCNFSFFSLISKRTSFSAEFKNGAGTRSFMNCKWTSK